MNTYSLNDIELGLEESFSIKVTNEKMEDFLRISGDNNPLHNDFEYAKSKGFQDRLVYGMLTSSFFSTLVGEYLPGKYCILHGIDIQFFNPVYIDNILTISGKVNYINEAYKQLEIKAVIINQDNTKISKATIKVGVMDE